jgi:outer membrane usher protein FimD/PapC
MRRAFFNTSPLASVHLPLWLLVLLALLLGPSFIIDAEANPHLEPAPTAQAQSAHHNIASHGPAPQSSSTAQLMPLESPLLLNGRYLGEIAVAVDESGAGEIDTARLLQLLKPHLDERWFTGLETLIAGKARTSFAHLTNERLSVTFQPNALETHVVAALDGLALQRIALSGLSAPDLATVKPPAKLAAGATMAVTQIWVHDDPIQARQPIVADLDGFISMGGFRGAIFHFGAQWTEDARSPWERAPMRVTYDYYDQALRASAGEFTISTTGFQSGGRVLGVGVAREYAAIRPLENVRAAGRGEVVLERESTVIVEVNNTELRRLRLQPGRYEVSDFGLSFGQSRVRLLVEDSAGRREVALIDLFNASTLLRVGASEFAASLGSQNSGEKVYEGPLTASGFYRFGAREGLTLGTGAQASADAWQISGETIMGAPIGLFRLTGAYSGRGVKTGMALAGDYRQEWRFSGDIATQVSATIEKRTARFSGPFSAPLARVDEDVRGALRLDTRLRDLSISAGFSRTHYRTRPFEQSFEAAVSRSFGRLTANLSFNADEDGAGDQEAFVGIGFSLRLSPRAAALVRYDGRLSHQRTAEIARYPREELNDFSGRLAFIADRDSERLASQIRVTNNRFDAELEHDTAYARIPTATDRQESRVRLASFIGFADGAIGIGRPPRAGFLLVERHRSLAQADAIVRDQSGGLVSRAGRIPGIASFDRAYAPSRFTFEADPVPDGYDLGDVDYRIFPGAGSAYRVMIGSDSSRSALGFLTGPNGPIAQSTATMTKVGDESFGERVIFTNKVGRFVADQLSPGRYRIQLDEATIWEFEIAAHQEGIVDVGRISPAAREHYHR